MGACNGSKQPPAVNLSQHLLLGITDKIDLCPVQIFGLNVRSDLSCQHKHYFPVILVVIRRTFLSGSGEVTGFLDFLTANPSSLAFLQKEPSVMAGLSRGWQRQGDHNCWHHSQLWEKEEELTVQKHRWHRNQLVEFHLNLNISILS